MTHHVLQLVEIQTVRSSNADISARIKESGKASRTRQFLVRRGGEDVGFIAVDPIPELGVLALYEIFVPKSLRGRGIGSALLQEVERMAAEQDFERVTLTPSPVERGFSERRLAAWYRRHGYKKRRGCPTEFQKSVSGGCGGNRP